MIFRPGHHGSAFTDTKLANVQGAVWCCTMHVQAKYRPMKVKGVQRNFCSPLNQRHCARRPLHKLRSKGRAAMLTGVVGCILGPAKYRFQTLASANATSEEIHQTRPPAELRIATSECHEVKASSSSSSSSPRPPCVAVATDCMIVTHLALKPVPQTRLSSPPTALGALEGTRVNIHHGASIHGPRLQPGPVNAGKETVPLGRRLCGFSGR